LEDSIERVLLVLKEEQDDSDSLAGDFDGIEEPPPVLKVSGMGNS
jgi:ribosome biogenesis ATPase